MKTLGEMTPQERAALTQEELDQLIDRVMAHPSYRPGGAYHVTLADLREFEPSFAQPLRPNGPRSFEALLTLEKARKEGAMI